MEQKGTILIGDGKELLQFYSKMKRPEAVLGIFCSITATLPSGLLRLGETDAAPAYLAKHGEVRSVYSSSTRITLECVRSIQDECKMRAIGFSIIPSIVNELGVPFVAKQVGGQVLLTRKKEPLSRLRNRVLKRMVDLLLVVFFLLFVFPFVYLVKAVCLKRKQRGPSFSFAKCTGPNKRVFTRVSFRGEGDSLANVFNVLRGNMSLVGPACHTLGDASAGASSDSLPMGIERSWLKPGMTGWAQVNKATEEERLADDLWYAEHWSLGLDIRILLKSVF